MTAARLYQIAATPEIAATWKNADGTPTVYVGEDNQATLVLANHLGGGIVLPAGTPAALGSLPAGQSALYLFFQGLLGNAEVEAIRATVSGDVPWGQATFTDEQGLAYLVLAPTAQVAVGDGAAVELRLAGVRAAEIRSGPVYASFAGAVGVAAHQAGTQAFVSVQNPPAADRQPLNLVVGFAGSGLVFTGGQSNDLTLFITNPNPAPLVPRGTAAWESDPPTFQLSLVFGDTAGALARAEDAGHVAVNVANLYGNDWKPVAAQTQGATPTWVMQPGTGGNGQVLGTGEHSTVEFTIQGIVTTLPQGLTLAYLSYANVPGYNDGFFALEIVKVAPVVIPRFTATPDAVSGATGGTAVTLDFQVQNASFVTVTNTAYAAPTGSADFTGTARATVHATTTFTLFASNFATGQQVARAAEVTVSPDPFHLVPTGTIVMWSGGEGTVPPGWAICDGRVCNGVTTPDLRSRFIQGADPALADGPGAVGSSGPADTHTHLINSASLTGTTAPAGGHRHVTRIQNTTTTLGGSYGIWALAATNLGAGKWSEFPSDVAPAHTHGFQLAVTGLSSQTQDASSRMRPAWYALYFIMKCV